MDDLRERVRVAKLKLSGFQSESVTQFLPGAAGVAKEVTSLLDDLIALHDDSTPRS
jgi:hypothetical protein